MATREPDAHADRPLVVAALRGDASAIEHLAIRLRCIPRILGAWNARLGRPLDEHDLADLAQDVTIIVLRKLDEYAGRAPFEAWVYRICRLELLGGIRRRGRARRRAPVPLDAVHEPETPTVDTEEYAQVHAALARLGGVEAETIWIKHFEGLTFEEIASRLGISANTAKTRYYRGLMKLESWLRHDDEQPPRDER